MKFCTKCGSELFDDAVFCSKCGTKQIMPNEQAAQYGQNAQYNQYVQQPGAQPQQGQYNQAAQYNPTAQYGQNAQYNQYVQQSAAQPQQGQFNQAAQYNPTAQYNQAAQYNPNAQYNQYIPQPGFQPPSEGTVKKGIKKPVIISAIVVLALGLGIGAYFLFFKKANKSPQEKVLDGFFEALSEMDMSKAESYCAPAGSEKYGTIIDQQGQSLSNQITNRFCFCRSTLQQMDYLRFEQEILDIYLSSYGFVSAKNGGWEDYCETNDDNARFKEKYKDFKVDYELVSLKKASEYTISYRDRIKKIEIPDMAEYISSNREVDVNDVYVAKIKIHWRYGNKKYGFDEAWWNNEKFTRAFENSGLYNERTGKKCTTYSQVINYYDNSVYDVFIYESNGEWYIFNPYIIRYYYSGWTVE